MAFDATNSEADAEEGEATPTKEQTDAELLEEARERFKLCEEFWGRNQNAWIEDAKFRNLDQWPSDVITLRGDERPCPVVDKCNQYVRQVVNDGRQNRPGVKVRPVDDKGDIKVAGAFQGVIRHICDRSNADEAFDTSLDHAAGNGYGFFRIVTEYAHSDTFNQDIGVQRIRNPVGVMLDPNVEAADGSDAEYGFVIDMIPKKKYAKLYPTAKITNFEGNADKYGDGWASSDNVRVCEYFYKVETPRVMHLLSDSTSSSDEDYQARLAAPPEGQALPTIKESRNIPKVEVRWIRFSGAEILEKNEWKGCYIPLIPVYGNESDIEGKVTYSGLIRAAKDAQRIYNYMAASFVEVVALTPKAPFVAAEGQTEGYEDEWKTANVGNKAVLTYKPTTVGEQMVPPPQRQPPSAIPAGYSQGLQHAEHDIQASMGMYNASIGEKSNEKSGRAILARQREGDTSTFHYQDNLNRAIRYLGRQLVDLIPKIYDSKRVIRILGEDGSADSAEIDPAQAQAVVQMGSTTIYNLGVGTYDVSVAAGPSYTTKRQESAEAMMQIAQGDAAVWQTHGDLIVKSQDWPNAEEFAKRSLLVMPPPLRQAIEAEDDKTQSPEVAAVKQQAQQVIQAKDQQIQAAEAGIQERDQALQKLQQENDALKSDRELNAQKLQLEMMKADNERLKLQNEANDRPIDTTAVEYAKIDADRDKAKLEADTQVIVAALGKAQAKDGAQQEASPVDEIKAPQVDTSAAIVAALQGFTEAMTRPRIATMPDGRQIRVQ